MKHCLRSRVPLPCKQRSVALAILISADYEALEKRQVICAYSFLAPAGNRWMCTTPENLRRRSSPKIRTLSAIEFDDFSGTRTISLSWLFNKVYRKDDHVLRVTCAGSSSFFIKHRTHTTTVIQGSLTSTLGTQTLASAGWQMRLGYSISDTHTHTHTPSSSCHTVYHHF